MSSNDFGAADIININVLGLLKDTSRTCPWPQNVPSILPGDGTGHFQLRTRGLVCSTEGFKILPDVCEGLLGVCRVPLVSTFAKQVIVVLILP